ncbi:hypothetical protein [Aeromonas hydrophila]|uniref:hypothetical protein n=1 Tax=Aeromonas hydrophila TaxID=644 RepID=UPI00236255EC|nr:hypothetical protein [Aeromonas hydrophila]
MKTQTSKDIYAIDIVNEIEQSVLRYHLIEQELKASQVPSDVIEGLLSGDDVIQYYREKIKSYIIQ